MKKIVLMLIGVIYMSSDSFGEVVQQSPDPKTWAESLTPKQLNELDAPTHLAIVEEFNDGDATNGVPKFKEYNFKSCMQFSYFSCISAANAQFSMSLNANRNVKGVSGVAAVTGSDAILFSDGSKVFIADETGKSVLEVGIKAKEFHKFDLRVISDKLLTALGYDGVVLAKNGDFVLVGATEARLKRPNLQGLAIGNSTKKWSIVADQKKGSSLLSLVDRWNGFGVFQEVVSGDGKAAVEPGTKVILESK